MYDTAKRSLAFTVATGGLLLTGPGYATALAATAAGAAPAPAKAQDGADSGKASPFSVTTPISVRAASAAKSGTAFGRQAGHRMTPWNGTDGPDGAAVLSAFSHSDGVSSGDSPAMPADRGVDLCGDQAQAVGSDCADGGAWPATGGRQGTDADAVPQSKDRTGVIVGRVLRAPINVSLYCGPQAKIVKAVDNAVGPHCSNSVVGTRGHALSAAPGIRSGGFGPGPVVQTPIDVPMNQGDEGAEGDAASMPLHFDGIPSGDSVQTPIDVPAHACGDQAKGSAVEDWAGGSACDADAFTPSMPGSKPAHSHRTTGRCDCTPPPPCSCTPPPPPPPCGCTPTPTPSTTWTPTPTPSTTWTPTPTPSHSCGCTPTSTPSTTWTPTPTPSTTHTWPCGCTSTPSPTVSSATTPPSTTPPSTPGKPQKNLAGTGGDEALVLGAAAATMLAGVGLVAAGRRRSR